MFVYNILYIYYIILPNPISTCTCRQINASKGTLRHMEVGNPLFAKECSFRRTPLSTSMLVSPSVTFLFTAPNHDGIYSTTCLCDGTHLVAKDPSAALAALEDLGEPTEAGVDQKITVMNCVFGRSSYTLIWTHMLGLSCYL